MFAWFLRVYMTVCLCVCALRTETRLIRALAWIEALGRRPKHRAELRIEISIQTCAYSPVRRRSKKVVVMGSLPMLEDNITFRFPWHTWISLATSASCLLPHVTFCRLQHVPLRYSRRTRPAFGRWLNAPCLQHTSLSTYRRVSRIGPDSKISSMFQVSLGYLLDELN